MQNENERKMKAKGTIEKKEGKKKGSKKRTIIWWD